MTDKTSLTGKYAIVTGSTQGLGEAIARLFVERRAAGIIICGRNVERGMSVAADLNSDCISGNDVARAFNKTAD